MDEKRDKLLDLFLRPSEEVDKLLYPQGDLSDTEVPDFDDVGFHSLTATFTVSEEEYSELWDLSQEELDKIFVKKIMDFLRNGANISFDVSVIEGSYGTKILNISSILPPRAP